MEIIYRLYCFCNKTYYGIIRKTWLVDLNKRPSWLQTNRQFAWIISSFFQRKLQFKVNNLLIMKANFILKHFNFTVHQNKQKSSLKFKQPFGYLRPTLFLCASTYKSHSSEEHAPVNLSQHTTENFRALFYTLDRFSVGWLKILVCLQHTLTPNKNSGA